MPDRMLIVDPSAAPNQAQLRDASTHTPVDNALVIAIPDGMTTEQVRRGLRQLLEVTRRRPNDVNGV